MGFKTVIDLARSFEEGRMWQSFMHKTGSPILPAAGWWADLSMAAGIPKYNAYVGNQLEGTPMIGSGNAGLYVGGPVYPQTKHVHRLYLKTAGATFAPAKFLLLDYLYFYPLVDVDSMDYQSFDNITSQVPRFDDGNDINVMIVTTTPQTASALCTMTYTNQAGIEGRTSSFYLQGPNNVGNLNCFGSSSVVGSANPFIPLQSGDTGVRKVDGLQMSGSAGGFVAVVMVKPMASMLIRETNTVCEHFFMKHKPSLPRIYDGAYLNYVFSCGVAGASSIIRGELEAFWG